MCLCWRLFMDESSLLALTSRHCPLHPVQLPGNTSSYNQINMNAYFWHCSGMCSLYCSTSDLNMYLHCLITLGTQETVISTCHLFYESLFEGDWAFPVSRFIMAYHAKKCSQSWHNTVTLSILLKPASYSRGVKPVLLPFDSNEGSA